MPRSQTMTATAKHFFCPLILLLNYLYLPLNSSAIIQKCDYIPEQFTLDCILNCWTPKSDPIPDKLGLQRSIQNLRIFLTRGNCSSLNQNTFRNYTGLKTLLIHGGGVREVGPRLFEHNSQLKIIRIVSVRLPYLPPTFLAASLIYLEEFDMEMGSNFAWVSLKSIGSNLKDLRLKITRSGLNVSRSDISGLKRLESLELIFLRGLRVFDTGALSGLSQLQFLSISNYRIHSAAKMGAFSITELPRLQEIRLMRVQVPTDNSSDPICKNLSKDVRTLWMKYCSIQILQRCEEAWICTACGRDPVANPQTVDLTLIDQASSSSEEKNWTLADVLPNRTVYPILNTTTLQLKKSVIKMIDSLDRFPYLVNYYNHRSLDSRIKQSVQRGKLGDITFFPRNPFLDLTQPDRLRDVRVSFVRCDCIIHETILWFRRRLPKTHLRLLCANLICMTDDTLANDGDEWMDNNFVVDALAPYCNGTASVSPKEAVTIPDILIECSDGSPVTFSSISLMSYLLMLVCCLHSGWQF